MSALNKANIKKAYYYLKRNGLANTYYAAKERMEEKKNSPYVFKAVSPEELQMQKVWADYFVVKEGPKAPSFSIVVPTYRTGKTFLQELLNSVMNQSYPKFELVLADATEDDSVKAVLDEYLESVNETAKYRVRYIHLDKNKGISENTNAGILEAKGDYIGLLDHDDLLTPNALYEMCQVIVSHPEGVDFIYSDEDKCDGEAKEFFEPNRKPEFDPDYILSNNYICHFLVMNGSLAKELLLRPEYDGAQDYDFVLRAWQKSKGRIYHVPKVLYHWRCHSASTAENPHSKEYAYTAGVRAVEDLIEKKGWSAEVVPLRHLGFHRIEYKKDFFEVRHELGAVGGVIIAGSKKGRIISGPMDPAGNCFYANLPGTYSGYMHTAVLPQQAEGLDIRCLKLNPDTKAKDIFKQITGVEYSEIPVMAYRNLDCRGSKVRRPEQNYVFDYKLLPKDCDYVGLSTKLSLALREAGYELLFKPEWVTVWKK